MSATLPHINHDEATMAEIRASLQRGREVITHTDAVTVPGWRGAGYIILDPVTGEGAYKIGGGQNGGYFAAGVLFGTTLGTVLFYINAAITVDAYPYAAAGLAVLLEQILITYLAYEFYGKWGGAQAQKCFISGIGIGLMAAGLTLEGLNKLLKVFAKKFPASAPAPVAVSSFIVTLLEAAIGWKLANQESSPVYKCVN
jgi:hypothetical protein